MLLPSLVTVPTFFLDIVETIYRNIMEGHRHLFDEYTSTFIHECKKVEEEAWKLVGCCPFLIEFSPLFHCWDQRKEGIDFFHEGQLQKIGRRK